MLKRILHSRQADSVEYLQRELNIDVASVDQSEKMVPSTIDEGGELELRTEQAFVELVNPLALEVVEAMLSPGV